MTLLQLEVPFEATSLTNARVTGPPQLSEAITAWVSGGGTCPKHWTATPAGHVIEGSVVSLTVINWTHVDSLPQRSTAR